MIDECLVVFITAMSSACAWSMVDSWYGVGEHGRDCDDCVTTRAYGWLASRTAPAWWAVHVDQLGTGIQHGTVPMQDAGSQPKSVLGTDSTLVWVQEY